MRRSTFIVAAILVHSLAMANPASSTYGQSLLDGLVHANPAVVAASFVAVPPKGKDAVVVASTDKSAIGARADAVDAAAGAAGATSVSPAPSGDRVIVRMALKDVSGDPIGGLILTFAGGDRERLVAQAEHIRDSLHRRISHAGNLFDPFPYETGAPLGTYAQQLSDEILEKHPEIEIFAIHATPPDSDYNIIAGSNIGRIGKKADNDDMRCVFTGKPNLEVNSTGKRFETELQLHDRGGAVIGAVGIVVAYKAGDDKEALHTRAEKIRAELESRIPDAASLFRPAH